MRRGFSLVELSIVLVILGLLTGGILAGQSLIRASELRSVTTEYNRYVTAIGSFRDKYFAIPGDMANATKFWDVAAVPATTCATTPSTNARTCDGNGDGSLPWNTDATSNEKFRFWQHLANAGLIEGSYTGAGGGGAYDTYYHLAGTNTPRAKIGGVTWGIMDGGTTASGDAFHYSGRHGNTMQIGIAGVHEPVQGFLTPSEAWNIDTKMDDGLPARGKVLGQNITTCTTSANNDDFNGAYRLDSSTKACSLGFPKTI